MYRIRITQTIYVIADVQYYIKNIIAHITRRNQTFLNIYTINPDECTEDLVSISPWHRENSWVNYISTRPWPPIPQDAGKHD